MCGVVGYSSSRPNEAHAAVLCAILRQSSVRGLHAFGALADDILFKTHDIAKAADFIAESFATQPPRSVLAHCRYSTSGDWHDHANNQPLVACGWALVFNGVIDMGTKSEMERRHGMKLETDNDGEVFLNRLQRGEEATRIVREHGSFAGLMRRVGEPEVYALRNSRRPLWVGQWNGGKFVASTLDIFHRAAFPGFAHQIPEGVLWPL